MLKWILILVAIWLLARWSGILRLVGGTRGGERLGRSGRRDPDPAAAARARPAPDRMADLTEQEITDADFEEIP